MAKNKTSIFQVEPHDDLSGVLETIARAQERRLIFIVDSDCKTFMDPANLRTISSWAAERGKEFVLVSQDTRLRTFAEGLCIPIYPDLDSACAVADPPNHEQKTLVFRLPFQPRRKTEATPEQQPPVKAEPRQSRPPEGPPKRKRRWRPKRGIAIAAVLLLLLLGGGLIYFQTQRTVIVLTAAQRASQGEMRILAAKPVAEAAVVTRRGDLAYQVPVKTLAEELAISGDVPTTGRKIIGVKSARGQVLFLNNSDQPIKVPAGTVVVTGSGERFRTLKEVTVPKRRIEYLQGVERGRQVGECEVTVEALAPGSKGNIRAAQINRIEGQFPQALKVVNTRAFTGGEDKPVPVVAAADKEALAAKLMEEADSQARVRLAATVGEDALLLPETITLAPGALTVGAKVGQEQPTLSGTLKVTAQGLVVQQGDLALAARHGMLAQVQGNWQPLGKPKWQIAKVEPGKDKQGAVLTLYFNGKVIGNPNPQALARALRRRKRSEIEAYLTKRAEIAGFEVTRGPRVLPSWERLITVIVQD